MSKDSADADIKTRVEELIQAVSVVTTGNVSVVNRDALAEVLTHDLGVATHQATSAGERLDKLETQTRALADAVIAIADSGPGPVVAPAVEAVKANMTGEITPSVAPSRGEYFDRRTKDEMFKDRKAPIEPMFLESVAPTPKDTEENRTQGMQILSDALEAQPNRAEERWNAATSQMRTSWIPGRDAERRINATKYQPERRSH